MTGLTDEPLDVAFFLAACTPDMEVWYRPLKAFGCNKIEYLEIVALWDEWDTEDFFRRVMAQPFGSHLSEAHLVFLLRGLAERFVDEL